MTRGIITAFLLTVNLFSATGDCSAAGPATTRASDLGAAFSPSTRPTSGHATDPNTTVRIAIRKYSADLKQIEAEEMTDIQRRERWFKATNELDTALRRNRITIFGTIAEVRMGPNGTNAVITPSELAIGPDDASDGRVMFDGFYPISISANQVQAARIAKGAELTVEGTAALSIDLSKPVLYQQVFYLLPDVPELGRRGTPAR